LKKLVEEAKLLKNELKIKYDIDVNSLQDLYDQTKKDLEKKLTEAEAKLSEIKADDEAE